MSKLQTQVSKIVIEVKMILFRQWKLLSQNSLMLYLKLATFWFRLQLYISRPKFAHYTGPLWHITSKCWRFISTYRQIISKFDFLKCHLQGLILYHKIVMYNVDILTCYLDVLTFEPEMFDFLYSNISTYYCVFGKHSCNHARLYNTGKLNAEEIVLFSSDNC